MVSIRETRIRPARRRSASPSYRSRSFDLSWFEMRRLRLRDGQGGHGPDARLLDSRACADLCGVDGATSTDPRPRSAFFELLHLDDGRTGSTDRIWTPQLSYGRLERETPRVGARRRGHSRQRSTIERQWNSRSEDRHTIASRIVAPA